jgi:hypothetical protein
MKSLRLHDPRIVFALAAALFVACGGDVGSEAGTSGTATGGAAASTGGTSGTGVAPGVGSGFALGGGIGVGGSVVSGGAASGLPWNCTAGFDPGYTCNGAYPINYYVYDAATANCVQATYNGCGGSTGGVFSDIRDCEAMCEQRPSDGSCPLYVSEGTACSVPGAFCSYGNSNCLCTQLGAYGCLYTDSRCSGLGLNAKPKSRCNGETCTITQDIVVITSRVCTCDNGLWSCSVTYM